MIPADPSRPSPHISQSQRAEKKFGTLGCLLKNIFPFSNPNTPSAPSRTDHKKKNSTRDNLRHEIHFWKCPISQKENPPTLSPCLKAVQRTARG
ncbi:hypothetical protein CEXT_116181 [Caerostris extrusa]|uniref:Uncharacterized protein n=1 Tax=Caerostris extrusa TaxID=172846 RepID=A0AAV4T733_CAEEX|nr:hypothetical protein CEXT_116181 [Caerostris extrusa]